LLLQIHQRERRDHQESNIDQHRDRSSPKTARLPRNKHYLCSKHHPKSRNREDWSYLSV